MASESMSIKLLVNKRTKKVLYAEAAKDFVDLLLQFFSLPVGTIDQLLGSKQMVGCFGKLKESVESFNENYFLPGINKDDIFDSKTAFSGNMLLLSNDVSSADDKPATSTKLYTCWKFGAVGYACLAATENPATKCPSCCSFMNLPLKLIGQPVVKEAEVKLSGGFVKDMVTYTMTDDLVVKPMSTISSIIHMSSLGVFDLSQLEEKIMHIGKEEALKFLKASFSTKEVLTTVFRQRKDV